MVQYFDEVARRHADLKYEGKEPPNFDFGDTQINTFMQPREQWMWQWDAWNQHGIMPNAGGLNDQPPEWEHDMRLASRIYNRRYWVIRREVKARGDHG